MKLLSFLVFYLLFLLPHYYYCTAFTTTSLDHHRIIILASDTTTTTTTTTTETTTQTETTTETYYYWTTTTTMTTTTATNQQEPDDLANKWGRHLLVKPVEHGLVGEAATKELEGRIQDSTDGLFTLHMPRSSGSMSNLESIHHITGGDSGRCLIAVGTYVTAFEAGSKRISASHLRRDFNHATVVSPNDTKDAEVNDRIIVLPYFIDDDENSEDVMKLERDSMKNIRAKVRQGKKSGRPFLALLLEPVLAGVGARLSDRFLIKLGNFACGNGFRLIVDEVLTGARTGVKGRMVMTMSMPQQFIKAVSYITMGKCFDCGLVLRRKRKPISTYDETTDLDCAPALGYWMALQQLQREIPRVRKEVVERRGLKNTWGVGALIYSDQDFPCDENKLMLRNRLLPRLDSGACVGNESEQLLDSTVNVTKQQHSERLHKVLDEWNQFVSESCRQFESNWLSSVLLRIKENRELLKKEEFTEAVSVLVDHSDIDSGIKEEFQRLIQKVTTKQPSRRRRNAGRATTNSTRRTKRSSCSTDDVGDSSSSQACNKRRRMSTRSNNPPKPPTTTESQQGPHQDDEENGLRRSTRLNPPKPSTTESQGGSHQDDEDNNASSPPSESEAGGGAILSPSSSSTPVQTRRSPRLNHQPSTTESQGGPDQDNEGNNASSPPSESEAGGGAMSPSSTPGKERTKTKEHTKTKERTKTKTRTGGSARDSSGSDKRVNISTVTDQSGASNGIRGRSWQRRKRTNESSTAEPDQSAASNGIDGPQRKRRNGLRKRTNESSTGTTNQSAASNYILRSSGRKIARVSY